VVRKSKAKEPNSCSSKDTFYNLKKEVKVNKVVVLHSPTVFSAVGAFYIDFSQVSDDEVIEIMNKYRYKWEL